MSRLSSSSVAFIVRAAAAACVCAAAWAGEPQAAPEAPRIEVARAGDRYRLSITVGGREVLCAPPEGLWSIACEWKDAWPASFVHADPAVLERVGEWTLLSGKVEAAGGAWDVRDAYRVKGNLIEGVRRFTWRGAAVCPTTTLSVRFQAPGARDVQAMLPGILYHGNPSGARSGRVPVFGGKSGELALFEEHRYPLPFASIEYVADSVRRGAALHSLPSEVPYGNLTDQWWSLGVAGIENGAELLLLSGACASNGRKSVIKAVQPGFLPYDRAWLDVPPGAIIEKTFFIEVYPVAAEGAGFSRPLRSSIELFAPFDEGRFPKIGDILRSKLAYARTRVVERGDAFGFSKYPDRPFFVMGWCGQADSLGYALQVLAPDLGESQALPWAERSLGFLCRSPFYERGFRTWYNVEKGEWTGDEVLSQGQALLNFARAIRVGRARKAATATWEAFFKKACDFHADRILAPGWRPVSTNEAYLVAPLCEGSRLFDVPRWREAALKAGLHYGERHVSMREPYWGGTLDASCEDKEGCYAAFQAFLALYELTHEARFLAWARHACDAVLSYVVVWDIDMPAGRLRDHRFLTTGWTVVSPQNQHVDVYGVIMAPDVYRLGELTNDATLRKLALVMYRSCGQLIDPRGSQGEQPQHTNYTQAGEAADLRKLRGGYNETWTVFWITAHFLNAAAQFKELGVDLGAH